MCPEIGKTFSTIHDFMVVPPEPDAGQGYDDDAKQIIKSEFTRVREFALTSRNFAREDGALTTIEHVLRIAAGIAV